MSAPRPYSISLPVLATSKLKTGSKSIFCVWSACKMVILVTTTTEPNWTATSSPGTPRGPHFAYGLGLQKKIKFMLWAVCVTWTPLLLLQGSCLLLGQLNARSLAQLATVGWLGFWSIESSVCVCIPLIWYFFVMQKLFGLVCEGVIVSCMAMIDWMDGWKKLVLRLCFAPVDVISSVFVRVRRMSCINIRTE